MSTNARRHFLVLHNPAAGRNGVGRARAVVDELLKRGAQVTFADIGDPAVSDKATAANYDAIVVSGGDGTIRAIAEKLRGQRIPIGIIPNGTGNVLAEELSLPRAAPEIADLLMHGPTHPIRGALVNGLLFLLMFGAGFDGDVISELSRTSIQLFGKLAYAGPLMRALIRKPRLFDISVNGVASRASWILISNACRYGGRFRLANQISIRDTRLIALVSHATTRRQRLVELLHLVAGRLPSASTIEATNLRNAEVPDTGIAAQCDGEPLPPGPYIVSQPDSETLIIAPAAS